MLSMAKLFLLDMLEELDKTAAAKAGVERYEVIDSIAIGVLVKRLAKPTEVGQLFAFLGSHASSYLTGSQVVIDGGSTLPESMTMGTN